MMNKSEMEQLVKYVEMELEELKMAKPEKPEKPESRKREKPMRWGSKGGPFVQGGRPESNRRRF